MIANPLAAGAHGRAEVLLNPELSRQESLFQSKKTK
jgi:hypothetical protein